MRDQVWGRYLSHGCALNGVEEMIGACFSGGKRSFGHRAGVVFATSFGLDVLRLVLCTAFRFCWGEREGGRR